MSYARICTIQAHCHLRVGLERVSQLVCENFGLKIAMVLIGAHLSLSLPPQGFHNVLHHRPAKQILYNVIGSSRPRIQVQVIFVLITVFKTCINTFYYSTTLSLEM